MSNHSTVCLFACGGAAANIAKKIHQPNTDEAQPGFARLHTFYVDTSLSNVPNGVQDNFFHITGTSSDVIDGSGMVRRTNHAAISKSIPEILHRFKPGNLNIILHSASGGSGSVIGPELVSELLANNESVIVITIGATTCEKELRNTIDTIASYQNISSKRSKPVLVSYLENGRKSMKENDAIVCLHVLLLAAIWSGENHGLDSADLRNFINYNVPAPKYQPMLTALNIYPEGEMPTYGKGRAVASVLTMIREGESPDPGMLVGYHTFGQLSKDASDAITIPSPIQLHSVQGYFSDVVDSLCAKVAEVDELYRVNPVSAIKIDSNLGEESGIVL